MKVFATHVGGQEGPGFLPVFRQLASQDQKRTHRLIDNPADADIILFLDVNEHQWDPTFSAITRHPLRQTFPHKTFIYNELDQPWCALPGLYVSMPRRGFDASRQRACSYITPLLNLHVENLARYAPAPTFGADQLFSFMGRQCHPVRDRILKLKHARAIIADTSEMDQFGGGGIDPGPMKLRYVESLIRSKFILCPRGAGTSSFRLYEAMAVGRVPVILSDDWVAPVGPDWNACSLRVREAETRSVPRLLEEVEGRFDEMAQSARQQWEEWFSPNVLFHRMVDSCGELLVTRRAEESALRRLADVRYLKLRVRALRNRLSGIFSG